MRESARILPAFRSEGNRKSFPDPAPEVMTREGYAITEEGITSWELGRRTPNEMTQRALETFLEQHPVIANPPRYGRWVKRDKPSEE